MENSIYKRTGIYGIRNNINGRTYVGKTMMNFGDRWDCHKAQLNGGYHDNRHLQNAWNKYGSDAFEFFIIEDCSDGDLINQLERKYIAEFRAVDKCYNISDGGDGGSMLGKHLSDETKQKIGARNREHMTGRKLSQETRHAMSVAQRKFWDNASDEYRANWGRMMSEKTSGCTWSDEAKARFSKLQQEHPNGAKYTVDDVRRIRRLHEEEKMTFTEIAQVMNMPRSTVYGIAAYKRWKNVK